jgi:hypothetical protein
MPPSGGNMKLPDVIEERSSLAQQRSTENEAYNCYLARRQRLCQLAVA